LKGNARIWARTTISFNTTSGLNHTKQKTQKTSLQITYANTRSLQSKTKLIQLHDKIYNPLNNGMVHVFNETWLTDRILNTVLDPKNIYTIYRKDRNNQVTNKKRGGGLLILVPSKIQSSLILEPSSNNSCELLGISLYLNGKTFKLYCVYRPPTPLVGNDIVHHFIENISHVLKHRNLILLGDFNLPNIDWSTETCKSTNERKILDEFIYNGLTQLINAPTRSKNILDLCFSNTSLIKHCTLRPPFGASTPLASDHQSLLITSKPIFSKDVERTTPNLKKLYDYSKAQWYEMAAFLSLINFYNIILQTPTLIQKWQTFKFTMDYIQNFFHSSFFKLL
jgi:hypothetical protein